MRVAQAAPIKQRLERAERFRERGQRHYELKANLVFNVIFKYSITPPFPLFSLIELTF